MPTTTPRTRSVFHVTTKDGKWIVTREGRPAGEFDAFETKDEAITRARALAQQEMPSQVKVHLADGTIQEEFTYGTDPYPPRG